MRERPNKNKTEEAFINQGQAEVTDSRVKDFRVYVKHSKWPIFKYNFNPSLAEGSILRKPITLPLKEYEWNSIDRHTKALGVQKSEWIRYAVFKLMSEEQAHFTKNKKNG